MRDRENEEILEGLYMVLELLERRQRMTAPSQFNAERIEVIKKAIAKFEAIARNT